MPAHPYASTYARLDCPLCRGPLTRVRRLAHEKAGQDLGDRRRYRCVAAGCAWEGLLPRRVRRPRQLARRRFVRAVGRQVRRLLLPASVLASLGVVAAALAWQAGLFAGSAPRGFAPGEHHEGERLPAAHALARHHARARPAAPAAPVSPAAPPGSISASAPAIDRRAAAGPDSTLQLRYGCVWGQPGRNPYRGSVEQALRSAALPEEVVRSIAAQVRAGQPVDRLVVANDGVHAEASGRVFDAQNIAMTYGQTLCLGTRVNFRTGHTEPAALYEAATADGRVLAVMVPEVCGNVSVLGQSDESVRLMRQAAGAAGSQGAAVARWMPAVLDGAGGAPVDGATQGVPEPGTLACVLAALAALAISRSRAARRH